MQVGVVGCGQIARPHVETLRSECGPIDLHLCDRNDQAAIALAQATGTAARFYNDADAMFDRVALDAVLVLTPPLAHASLARAAMERGAHVLVEKPFTMSVAEAESLFRLADSRDLVLTVDHSNLFMPNVADGLALLERGTMGRPLNFHCFYGHAERGQHIPYGNPEHWAYQMPGGVLLNLISHPASLLVAMIGTPIEVIARRAARNAMPNEIADSLAVMVDTGAAYGTIAISMAHGNHHRHATVWCEGGTLVFDLTRQTLVVSRHRGPIGLVPKLVGGVQSGLAQARATLGVSARVATGRLQREPGVRALTRAFIDAVRTGSDAPVTRDNVLGVARIQEIALETAGEVVA